MIIRFRLHRIEDETGISGVGDVAEGVILSSGKCVLAWTTKINSIAIYDNLDDLKAIHCHGGKTEVVFDDDPLIYCYKCSGCELVTYSMYSNFLGMPHIDCSAGNGKWMNYYDK